MDLLADLHENGATICMVTHDPRFAGYADRTVHLFDGQIVAENSENEGEITPRDFNGK
jgi:putative ABC transport system ATP-binding protein